MDACGEFSVKLPPEIVLTMVQDYLDYHFFSTKVNPCQVISAVIHPDGSMSIIGKFDSEEDD